LIVFALFAALFGAPAGLVTACLWAALNPTLLLKYTEFTGAIVVPLYFWALYRMVESPRPRRALALGIVLGVTGYAHAVAFVGGIVVAVLATLAAALWRAAHGAMARELGQAARALAIALVCCVLALGYWYRPLFVDHARTSPH